MVDSAERRGAQRLLRLWSTGLSAVLIAGLATPALSQSREFMMNECGNVAQNYFRAFNARTDMQYNGQRVDGTHAINGRIFLETRYEDFACSYERSGRRMVEFFAEGRLQNAYLPDYGAPAPPGRRLLQVTGVAANDVLNVRSGPGTNFRIVGALSNGTSVREIQCEAVGGARWCEIEMLTDMRERGWVNARFLTAGGASQLPSAPPAQPAPPSGSGASVRVTGLAPGGRVNLRSGPGTDFRVVANLSNGMAVTRYGCRTSGGIRWCEVQTAQGANGWISARYLSDERGQAAQLPSAPGAVRVRFEPGTTGAELTGQLLPQEARRYLLGASAGQDLYFRLAANGPNMIYGIQNPDGSYLIDQMGAEREYRGQLYQSGDHVITVINRANGAQSYNVIFGVR